jgi:hypothetical protein
LTNKRVSQVEAWTWILLYGGLLVLVLGLAIEGRDAALGWSLVTAGGVAAAAGLALIVVRSRMNTDN